MGQVCQRVRHRFARLIPLDHIQEWPQAQFKRRALRDVRRLPRRGQERIRRTHRNGPDSVGGEIDSNVGNEDREIGKIERL